MRPRTSRSELRRRAEARIKDGSGRAKAPAAADAERLLHELRVHQVELEMQNEELRASRLEAENLLARYTELFDFAPLGFVQLAHHGAVLACNFAAARLLGRERGTLVGQRLAALLRSEDARAFEEFLTAVLTQSEEDSSRTPPELEVRPNNGGLRVRLTGVVLEQGAVPTALLALEDVTARRAAEEALREEGRHKDEFLAALSHELRNPLAPIRNSLALLRLLPAGSERAGGALTVIDRQVDHLTHIVDDLLDVTRVARGKVRLQLRLLDLVDLARRTIEDHRAAFDERGVRIAVDLPPAPCWVEGDPSRLAQVLGNLLANAIKFTNPGGRVEVAVACEESTAVLRVRDDGIGIERALLDHVFEPFTQGAQSLDRARGGLGLGLATVKGLVELHRGAIEVESDGPGRGALFTVRVPCASPPQARAPAAAGPRRARTPRRVLIVEDNSDAAQSLRDLLELGGHEVRVAGDGPTGLLLTREFRPEVILCDLGLPGMDGFALARSLRADERAGRPWLVALSGYGQPEDVRRASDSGFDRHVTKPASPEAIEEAIAQAGERAG